MAWDVRPTADLEEFKRRRRRDLALLRRLARDDEAAQRFSANLPLERMHAAFDGDRIVGGAGAFPFQLTVPGGAVRCGGVTVVGVLPTHRRRGVLTAMMRAQLEDIRERGEPIAALWASEEVIYRRFGYGIASLSGEMALPSGYAGLREPPDDRARASGHARGGEGRARGDLRPRPAADAGHVRAHRDVVGAAQPGRSAGPAAGRRREERRSCSSSTASPPVTRSTASTRSARAARRPGHVDVIEAIADGPVATRELWRVLLEMDWMATLKAYLLPIDHPLLHLLRYPRRMQMRVGDGLWVRLVDVGAALSARAYGGDEPVVFEVDDAVPAGELGPLAARRRAGRADGRRRRISRSTSASSARRTSAASRSASSCARAASAS